MAKNAKAAGTRRELQVVEQYREAGWVAFRTPASLGVCDVVAMRAARQVTVIGRHPIPRIAQIRMIEVKANTGSPYKTFVPEDRQALSTAARIAGAEAVLFHWPAHGEPREYQESEWPRQKEQN